VATAFFATLLRGQTAADANHIMQSLPLLRVALPLLPQWSLQELVQPLLRLPQSGASRMLAASAYALLTALLEAQRARLTLRFVKVVLGALTSAIPSPDDHATASEYCYAVAAALVRLASMERVKAGAAQDVSLTFPRPLDPAPGKMSPLESTAELLPRAMAAVMSAAFPSGREALHHAGTNAIAIMVAAAVDGVMIARASEYALANPRKLSEATAAIVSSSSATAQGSDAVAEASAIGLPLTVPALVRVCCLLAALPASFRFQPSWPVSLGLLALLFRLLGDAALPLLDPALASMVKLRATLVGAVDAAALADDDGDSSSDDDRGHGGRRGGRVRFNGPQGNKRRRMTIRAEKDGDNDGASSGDEGPAGAKGGRGGSNAARSVEEEVVTSRSSGAVAAYRSVMRVLAATVKAVGAHRFVPGAVAAMSATPVNTSDPAAVAAALLTDEVAWVLPLLRDNASFAPCPLGWFATVILPAIRMSEAQAAKHAAAGLPKNARACRAKCLQLWALFPAAMAAAPDLPAFFGPQLGKVLTSVLVDPNWPDLTAVICRGLETGILRSREALGLPSIQVLSAAAEDDDEADDDEEDMGAGKRKGGDASSDDESDDDSDAASDAAGSAAPQAGKGPRGDRQRDAATVVFGAGGVSVYGGTGEEVGASDPRHALIAAALTPSAKLPTIEPAAATANLKAFEVVARNYVPVLFNVCESCILGTAPAGAATSNAALASVAHQMSTVMSQERTKKALDVVTAYLTVSPTDLASSMGDRLLGLLSDANAKLAKADEDVAAARKALSLAAKKAKKAAGKARAAAAAASAGMDEEEVSKPAAAAAPAAEAAVSLNPLIKQAAQAAARVISLLALALSLLPTLRAQADAANTNQQLPAFVSKLYDRLALTVGDDTHPKVQKRAYRTLATLLSVFPAFAADEKMRNKVVALLQTSLMTVSASARKGRLQCLAFVVAALDIAEEAHLRLVPALLGEAMLCTKDTNGRVRSAAFDLLSVMARKMADGGEGDGGASWDADAVDVEESEDEEEDMDGEETEEAAVRRVAKAAAKAAAAPTSTETTEEGDAAEMPEATLSEFFRMVVAGLVSGTPHMRAAAIQSLARLVYDFSGYEAVHKLMGPLLRTILILAGEKSREVIKAVVGFVKVVVSCMPPRETEAHLPLMIQAMMTWSGESKNRIRAKIKGVLERMVRKFGWDAVASHVPLTDQKLVQHMKKQADRKERRKLDAMEAAEGAGGMGADGKTVVSKRTRFEDMAGIDDDEDEDDFFDEDAESGNDDARTQMTNAKSVAKSWGVVGSRITAAQRIAASKATALRNQALGSDGKSIVAGGSAMPGARGNLMAAITADARGFYKGVGAAPLPPVGAIVEADAKKRGKDGKTMLTTRTAASGGRKTMLTSATGAGAAAAKNRPVVSSAILRADDDTPLDLLDAGALRSMVGTDVGTLRLLDRQRRSAAIADASGGLGSGIRLGKDGRLIIEDPEAADDGKVKAKTVGFADEEGDEGANKGNFDGEGGKDAARRRRMMKRKAGRGDQGDEDDEGGANGGKADLRGAALPSALQGWGRDKTKGGFRMAEAKAQSKKTGGIQFNGGQFKSNKAAGDVMKKGDRFQPFAYIPLESKAMSQAGGDLAVSRFAGVMESTSKQAKSAIRKATNVLGKRKRDD
jgi:hypothetical protein